MAAATVADLLKSLRGASPEVVRRALPALANFNVVVPVLRFQNLNDPQGTRRIQVVHRQNGERREVSVFSSEDLLLSWAKDEVYQCFSVAAGDLALTLPSPSWLVFEAGTPDELILPPELVKILAWGEEPGAAVEAPAPQPPPASPPRSQNPRATATVSVADVIPEPLPPQPPVAAEDSEKREEALQADLRELLARYPLIEEAYLVAATGAPTTYLLGILAAELRPELRFALIEEIAQRSQKYFGEAGAIEVYDDLRLSSSRSWDLFQTYIPFFVRGEPADVAGGALRSQLIEESDEPNSSQNSRRLFWGLKPGSAPIGKGKGTPV